MASLAYAALVHHSSNIHPNNHATKNHGTIKGITRTAASIMKERKGSQQHKESVAAVIPSLPST